MKYLLLLNSLLFFTNIFCLQKDSVQCILAQANARVAQLNQDLLEIVRIADSQERKTHLACYYVYQRPDAQTTFLAYIKKRRINMLKAIDYLKLLRFSSMKVRQNAEKFLTIKELETAPIDRTMFYYANDEWPLKSIKYELQEMADELEDIYHCAYTQIAGWDQNHDETLRHLAHLKKDHTELLNAIAQCEQPMNNQ